jgi:hypothetical protein
MISNTSLSRKLMTTAAVTMAFAVPFPALAESVIVHKGADVHLIFDTPLDGGKAHAGDWIRFHLEDDLTSDGRVVVPAGTTVRGQIENVKHRGRYGYNGNVQIAMEPLRLGHGVKIPLRAKNKGRLYSSDTGKAAGATAAGAVVLGPVGLIAGYFVVGKNIHAQPGSKTTVEVADDVSVNVP